MLPPRRRQCRGLPARGQHPAAAAAAAPAAAAGRLAAAFPGTVDAVFRRVFGNRSFSWQQDGRGLLRKRKPG
jgi:hypothetical protein